MSDPREHLIRAEQYIKYNLTALCEEMLLLVDGMNAGPHTVNLVHTLNKLYSSNSLLLAKDMVAYAAMKRIAGL
jgi:hypothetical protein